MEALNNTLEPILFTSTLRFLKSAFIALVKNGIHDALSLKLR
ncbi:hypothetical protein LLB_1057 [Legionella longbeachae D-4968]|nr:hypothetical protein LLB_1057 [Legionella longbeachae D-4968]